MQLQESISNVDITNIFAKQFSAVYIQSHADLLAEDRVLQLSNDISCKALSTAA
jgi:hypothetical protein